MALQGMLEEKYYCATDIELPFVGFFLACAHGIPVNVGITEIYTIYSDLKGSVTDYICNVYIGSLV